MYEYFLKEFAVNATKEEGEFYMSHDAVQLIASMIEPFDGTLYDKRQAYLIQTNGKRKSPKALDTRGSGDCLLLDASIWNGHFRRKRPTIAHQVLSTGANEKEIV